MNETINDTEIVDCSLNPHEFLEVNLKMFDLALFFNFQVKFFLISVVGSIIGLLGLFGNASTALILTRQEKCKNSNFRHSDIIRIMKQCIFKREREREKEHIFRKYTPSRYAGVHVRVQHIYSPVLGVIIKHTFRPSMRNPNNLFLTALAVFDSCLIITAFCIYAMEYIIEYTRAFNLYVAWLTYLR